MSTLLFSTVDEFMCTESLKLQTYSFGNHLLQSSVSYLLFMICYIAIKIKISSSKGKLIYHGNLVYDIWSQMR